MAYNAWRTDREKYIPLCRAIQMGDWEKAQEFFDQDEDALTDKLDYNGSTALHLAIGNPQNIRILENLLERINPDSLPALLNDDDQNALYYAAMLDNTVAAKKLVDRNPHLLFVVHHKNRLLPVERAVGNSHRTTFVYLLQMCKHHIGLSQKDGYHNPFEGERGSRFLCGTIMAGFLDVAYDLLKDYPQLASTQLASKVSPLWCIARKWDAYPSAKRYNFYQQFVYSYVPAENYGVEDIQKIHDIENQETYKANRIMKSYVYPADLTSLNDIVLILLSSYQLSTVSHVKQLHEDKVKHNRALTILNFICEEVGKLRSNHDEHCYEAYISAVETNTPEVIRQITRIFPHYIRVNDKEGCSLAQHSIMNRCEHVYNFLVYEVTQDKYIHMASTDGAGNNLAHLAGRLASLDKLNKVTGAALQMQRELQWFQEVCNFIRPSELRDTRNSKQETPIMVFRKEHKDLRKEGEEWMKKTADSYTITAALIITIVFAAAITVPGGNNGDTGKPVFESKPSFIIFVVSDAISLFTSTTSLLFFLSILTARYAEEDFLYKLPKRLILGLAMLFMSVTTMLIAFSASLYVMFGLENPWILIPIAAITCLPIASFVTLQLPLLVDLISSTYSRGIFGKRAGLSLGLYDKKA
ncbi:hypothetical protein E3N88_33383 [Mikania micrantha]|uniref:PGG domain-containing protein n=1 Tax=Mikania micrantha TaxID=192012 RepID=A0A5N6MBP7_9ASTR|nr:hypothetical protein E3N88_33383 [Mikania micrantha]